MNVLPKTRRRSVPAPEPVRIEATDATPLGDVRASLAKLAKRRGGCICPACGRRATLYQRAVNGSIVRVLEALAVYRSLHGEDYANLPRDLFRDPLYRCVGSTASQGGQWAAAAHWDLLERKASDVRKDGSSRTGLARLTLRGLAFLQGRYRIRRWALVFDGVCLGKYGDLVRPGDVSDFDYREAFPEEPPASDLPLFEDEGLSASSSHFLDVRTIVFGS